MPNDARASMEELRPIGVESDQDEWGETIGTYVLSKLGRLPRKGDKVQLRGATAEITALSRRRITHLRVRVERKEGDARTDASGPDLARS